MTLSRSCFKSIDFTDGDGSPIVETPDGLTVSAGGALGTGSDSIVSGSWTGLVADALVKIVVNDGFGADITLTNSIDFNNLPDFVPVLPEAANKTHLEVVNNNLVFHHNGAPLDLSTIFYDMDGDTITYGKNGENVNFRIVGTNLEWISEEHTGDLLLNVSDGFSSRPITIEAIYNSGATVKDGQPVGKDGQIASYFHKSGDLDIETIYFNDRYAPGIAGDTLDFEITYTYNNNVVTVDVGTIDGDNDGVFFDSTTNEFRGELKPAFYSGDRDCFWKFNNRVC